MDLADRHAKRGKVPPLESAQIDALLPQLPLWSLHEEEGPKQLRRQLRFTSFRKAMDFVDRMADLAEAEDHHPDFSVHYDRVEITLSTHDAGGVTENDLILAARIDRLVPPG